MTYAYINRTRYDDNLKVVTDADRTDWSVTVDADLYHLLGEKVPVVIVESLDGERWSGQAIVVSADLDREHRGARSKLRGDGPLLTRAESWAARQRQHEEGR